MGMGSCISRLMASPYDEIKCLYDEGLYDEIKCLYDEGLYDEDLYFIKQNKVIALLIITYIEIII